LPYPHVEVIKAVVLPGYEQNARENDLAVLLLARPLGLCSGWFGLARLPDETLKLERFEVSGYASSLSDGVVQYSAKGKFEVLGEHYLEYSLDATAGQDGGPLTVERVISETESEFYLVGVHAGSNSKRNYGIRLNAQKF
jgi:V8-like Glu-specific endopeptidase